MLIPGFTADNSVYKTMARYRMTTVPQFIVGAATLSAVAFIVLLV